MKKEMTWNEVGQYYGRSYKKIIEALKINSETLINQYQPFLHSCLQGKLHLFLIFSFCQELAL